MLWIPVALLGYFFNAVSALFDKYLLSDRIPTPSVYAFFVSIFSLFAFPFVFFGFQFFDWESTMLFLLSGALFLYGLVAFYAAVKRHEISRIAPLVGVVISLVALLSASVPALPETGSADSIQMLSLVLLIAGGFLIAFDLPFRPGERIPVYVLVAGVLMAVSLILLKIGYAQANFISGLVWSRLGIFVAGMSLLLVPVFRREILSACRKTSEKPRASAGTGLWFVVNKTCAGVASFLISYATFLGPVTFVQALSGMQYVFLLALALPLSFRFPRVFDEKLFFWDWFQKVIAILLIAFGLWLAATNGVKLLI